MRACPGPWVSELKHFEQTYERQTKIQHLFVLFNYLILINSRETEEKVNGFKPNKDINNNNNNNNGFLYSAQVRHAVMLMALQHYHQSLNSVLGHDTPYHKV